LWFGYSWFIIPVYGYAGFELEPNALKVFESIVVLVLIAIMLPTKVNKPSDIYIHAQLLLPVLPMLVLYGASDLPRDYMYFVIVAFAIMSLFCQIRFPIFPRGLISTHAMMWILLVVLSGYIISIIYQGGLMYFNLDIMKVYDFRDEAAQNLPDIYGYLSGIVEKVILPFALMLSVYHRKWIVAALVLSQSVILFGLTTHKGTMFYPFIVLGIYWIMNKPRRAINALIVCYILVIIFSLIPYALSIFKGSEPTLSNIIVGAMSMRRGYFVPALLNFQYYDFFSVNPTVMLSQSKLSLGMVEYPYGIDTSHLIGYYYNNNIASGANTGWLGSGYMHFGFLGMILYAMAIGSILSLVNMISRRRGLGISVAIVFTPFLAVFLSSDLPVVCLTHGLFVALILAWVCRFPMITVTTMQSKKKALTP